MSEQNNVKNKNLINAFIMAALIAAIFYLIAKKFDTSSSIILSFVGLGVVIFIHELGHFAAGKLCGIKVEAFAIGFGTILLAVKRIDNYLQMRILPTILEKENDPDKTGLLCVRIPMKGKAGETEYQLRIFPVGGFVKLTGQEDLGSDKPSDDPRSFVNVAIWKRVVAVSAGVTLNVVLAAVLFVIVFMNGINLAPAVIGDVKPGYPAAKAGLKAGDEIIAVNGRSNIDFMAVAFAAALTGKDEPVNLQVKKTDGGIADIDIVPILMYDIGVKGFGIEQPATLEIAEVEKSESLEKKIGLKSGDVLTAVDGQQVEHFWDFKDKINNIFKPNVVLSFKRAGQEKIIDGNFDLQYTSAIVYQENGIFVPSNVYGLVPRIKVFSVEKDKLSFLKRLISKFKGETLPDANAGLQPKDVIVQIGDVANPTYKELREATNANAGKELKVVVLRANEIVQTTIKPRTEGDRVLLGIIAVADFNSTVAAAICDVNTCPSAIDVPRGSEIASIAGIEVKNYYDIARVLDENRGKTVKVTYKGVLDNEEISFAVPATGPFIMAEPLMVESPAFKMLRKLYRASGPADALKMGSRKTLEFVGQTYMTLKGLITRDISTKSLMGPVGMIAASSKIISERDCMQYFYFMGMISACLAVMNFLPLPIFDGGLVVLLIIEKIKGSPVHEKVQEVLVYIGLVLILGLVVLVTYNDIIRLIFG